MSDSSNKRTSSFRKLFPSLFFSNKSKEKAKKHSRIGYKKSSLDNSSNSNQYENPRTVKDNVPCENNDVGRIYENLAIVQYPNDIDSSCNTASSNRSSSSTLVSESIKTQTEDNSNLSKEYDGARPQVPRKPYNELNNTPNTAAYSSKTQFPDVYYHSVEKITETLSPLDEIEVYRAVQSYAKPASVGAEIKRVSTKFLISPKKEAEVRTIQPKRARSFSFDNKHKEISNPEENSNNNSLATKREENIKKSYNYSAPTSPTPANHKIPNMPKTVSPYGHVKKSLNEAEERRNSLNRTGLQKPPHSVARSPIQTKEANITQNKTIGFERTEQKVRARQKLEAFYWQKLKELKQKEDEFLLEQSINSTVSRSTLKYPPHANYNCSLPRQYKTNSLPRDGELRFNSTCKFTHLSSPFSRGVPERRTDTFLRSNNQNHTDIVYRHPEKLQSTNNKKTWPRELPPSPQRYPKGSLKQDSHTFSLQPKRVSFEEQIYDTDPKCIRPDHICSPNEAPSIEERSKGMLTSPPHPPVRTTSVGTSNIVNNHRIIHPPSAHYSLYSESESGSEASEIQRILLSDTQKDGTTGAATDVYTGAGNISICNCL